MKKYQFHLYCNNRLLSSPICELADIHAASYQAMFFLSGEYDGFYDTVRFYRIDHNRLHTQVYKISKDIEQTDNMQP